MEFFDVTSDYFISSPLEIYWTIATIRLLPQVGNCRQSNIFTVAGVHTTIIIPQNQHWSHVGWQGCYCLPHVYQRSIQVTLRSPAYGHYSLWKAADLPRKTGCVDCDDKNTKKFKTQILHDFRHPVIPLYIFRHRHRPLCLTTTASLITYEKTMLGHPCTRSKYPSRASSWTGLQEGMLRSIWLALLVTKAFRDQNFNPDTTFSFLHDDGLII